MHGVLAFLAARAELTVAVHGDELVSDDPAPAPAPPWERRNVGSVLLEQHRNDDLAR